MTPFSSFEITETVLFLVIILFDVLLWWDSRQMRRDSREMLNLYREYFAERKAWREAQRKSRAKKVEEPKSAEADAAIN